MLCRWEELPAFMRNEEVRPYYNILKKHSLSLLIKRTFDFVMSSIMLVLLMPVFLMLAVWIKVDSKGSVFYRQERVTQYGRLFKIYKFRTMVQNADRIGNLVTVSGDSRITDVGKKLRGCRLDELPQLINIWKGEMTFVGTRPEVPKYVRQYSKEMYATLLLPAGVTSEASISFRDEDEMLAGVGGEEIDKIYVQKILMEKMKVNLHYIQEFALSVDLLNLFKTVLVIIQ